MNGWRRISYNKAWSALCTNKVDDRCFGTFRLDSLESNLCIRKHAVFNYGADMAHRNQSINMVVENRCDLRIFHCRTLPNLWGNVSNDIFSFLALMLVSVLYKKAGTQLRTWCSFWVKNLDIPLKFDILTLQDAKE